MRPIVRGLLLLLIAWGATTCWAADLRAEMQANNAAWLAAYNSFDGPALGKFYSSDAMILLPGARPIVGAEAITKFWQDRIRDRKRRNHTFQIVSVSSHGKLAYQVAKFTVDVVDDKGEVTEVAGNTVRIFERQSNGNWLTKVQIWNTL